MADTVACAKCGQENLATQRFCGGCGQAMVRACPTCGETNPAPFRFCGSCGAALDAAAAAPSRLALGPATVQADQGDADLPMIGRDRELELLHTTWQRVRSERSPHLVTVLAAAGVGKTRLYREFAVAVRAGGGRTVSGRSFPYGESTGWGAFAQQLRAVAGIFETDPVPVAGEKLSASVAAVLPPEAATTVGAHLAQMTGLSDDSKADKGSLLLSARRFAEALALDQPTVLIFEDLHWADPTLFELVESLAGRCRDAPLLVLVLARPELLDARPRWGGGLASHTNLVLSDLSAEESRHLLAQLLPGISDPRVVERLVERAGGNPLFLEELSASLEERVAETAVELPTSVRATIAARLDSLPGPERQLLLDASVVGRVFWVGALARLGTSPADLPRLLDSLEARDFIRRERRSGIEGDEQFSFKHVLIREVAYGILPRAARRQRHAVVARFIEDIASSYVEEAGASLLAYHWQEAGDSDAAVRYLLLAADNAGRAWAKGEAVALLNQALDLIPEADVDRRRKVRLLRAVMRLEAVDYVTAAAELDVLLPELTGREQLEALLTRARCAGLLQDASAFAFGQQAVELARAQGHDDLVGPALALVGTGANLAGRPAEALAMAERALDAWFPGSRPSDLAWCLGMAGLASYHLGRHEEATSYGRRGHDLAQEIHSGEVLIFDGGQVAMGLTGSGRHEEALAFLEPLVAHAIELGTVLPWTARAINIAGGTLRELYALDEARARNHEAAEVAARAPFPIAVVQSEVDLLFVDLAEGEVGKVDVAWPRLWEAAQGLKGFHTWLVSGRLEAARAEISLGLGDLEAAATAATTALASAQRHGRLKYEVLARMVLAEALTGLGRREEGVAQARAARDGSERLGHPPSRWRAEATLSRILAATGDDAGAEAALASARRTIGGFAAGLSDARRPGLLAAEPVAAILSG